MYAYLRKEIEVHWNNLNQGTGANGEVSIMNFMSHEMWANKDQQNQQKNQNRNIQCYYFKMKGHIKPECNKKKNDMQKNYCNHCKISAHYDEKCWLLHP